MKSFRCGSALTRRWPLAIPAVRLTDSICPLVIRHKSNSDVPNRYTGQPVGINAALPKTHKALADRVWEFGGKPLRFRRVPAVPKFIVDNYDDNFQREYPQLAVAIG